MRILQAIESSGPGGAERVVIHLAAGLQSRGHAVRVLLLRPGWLSEELRTHGVDVSILPMSRPLDPQLLRALSGATRSFSADVLHTHEFTFSFYGRLARSGRSRLHVATAHGDNFAETRKRAWLGAICFRGRRRFVLNTVSLDLRDRLASTLRLAPERIPIVHNGIPLPPPSTSHSRASDAPLRLLAIGNLYPVKNHALMIRAVGRLIERGTSVVLDILGRGEEEHALTALVDELDLADRVRLHGLRGDVSAFLRRADLLVSTSHHEGMPVSFLEAMSHGVPVVAPRVGGIPEAIAAEEEGLLFTPGDLEQLAAHIERLADDEPLRRRLGRNAERRARERFSVERMVDSYLALYAALA